MKKKITILVLLSSLNLVAQIKGIEVTYVKGIKKISDQTSNTPKILQGITYKLIASKTSSKFKYNEDDNIQEVNLRFVGRGGGKGIYYKNLKEKIKLRQRKSDHNSNIYLIKGRKYNWELTKEKKTINSYLCYKAIAKFEEFNPFNGKTIKFERVAWYTPQIPYPFGPAGYDGLPGLVLVLKAGGFYFIAENIKLLKKIDLNTLSKPTSGIKVTLEEYNNELKKETEKEFGKGFFNNKKKN